MGVRLPGIVLSVLVLSGLTFWDAHRRQQVSAALERARADLAASQAALDESHRALELARRTATIVTRYVDRVRTVRERGDTLTKEIPVHVTAQADAACPIPAGFVRVHDAAAKGIELAGTAGDPDAAAAGVTLASVAETTADNYARCHATAAQVDGLQAYVRELLDALEAQGSPP